MFQQRYFQKLYGSDAAGMARDMAQVMAMYPQMKIGMARLEKEGGKLDGTPVLDIKPFIPSNDAPKDACTPEWK